MRRIAILTTTRADWGLLQPVARLLRDCDDVELRIIAANMHFDESRGMTVNEIVGDGFEIDAAIKCRPVDDTRRAMAMAMGATMSAAADIFEAMKPDMLLVLGDRFETLAVATAATVMSIPIAHISGGEITVGAIDDSFRHAITKMASLHFATTECHRRRLIAMGEQPDNVINAGALGVENMLKAAIMSRDELEQSLGFALGDNPVLVTFHPATNDAVDARARMAELLEALSRFDSLSPLFTYPNNDASGQPLIAMIEEYVAHHPGAHAVASLGHRRYLSMLHHAVAVIGNSSSGIVEAPSAGIPTVDVGCRQQGRTSAATVIHCGDSADEIEQGIKQALDAQFRAMCAHADNPYYKPSTAKTIVDKLTSVDISTLLPKVFYDINQCDENCV